MKYKKNSRKDSKGKKFPETFVTKKRIKYLSIKQFIETYGLNLTVEAVGYHMKTNKIDYMQPVRDRFVLITKTTLNFYEIDE